MLLINLASKGLNKNMADLTLSNFSAVAWQPPDTNSAQARASVVRQTYWHNGRELHGNTEEEQCSCCEGKLLLLIVKS